MSEAEATTSTTDSTEPEKITEDLLEPEAKRRKTAAIQQDEKKYRLEERLGGILCCAVCLDLPKAAVYQVSAFASCRFP
ncbi:Cysteine and histidine-rich protein 1 homolog-like Protein [Tribolium castaneum]|uniref:Cysteine and histidine-rich protein 1 homolog-like Protein n=1 Tax=Tribolium castaneum TaxID=7070 RepID=A0A139WHG0_TRICA|nr:Cysteine and histidine-rich protein 1 homolog-like Protein [Tribolium castaneum]